MSQANVEKVRALYAEWGRGNLVPGADIYDRYLTFIPLEDTAETGLYIGAEGVGQFMRAWMQSWSQLTVAAEEILEAGDHVVIETHQRGVGKESGLPGELTLYAVWSFRGGTVIRIEHFRSREEALEAVGLSGDAPDEGRDTPVSQGNVEIVRRIYTEWGRGDYSSTDWQHPAVEFVMVDGPNPGSWIGAAGITEGWGDFLSAWQDFRHQADGYHELDDERILVLFHFSGRGKASGVQVEQTGGKAAAVFHLRDGKVTRIVLHFDRAAALESVGPTQWPDPPAGAIQS